MTGIIAKVLTRKPEVYPWKGNVTTIKLTYNSQSEEVFLEIGSTRAVKSFVEEIKKGKAEEW